MTFLLPPGIKGLKTTPLIAGIKTAVKISICTKKLHQRKILDRFLKISLLKVDFEPFKHQPHQIVKRTQIIRRQQQTNCLSVFGYFVGLALKGLRFELLHCTI